MADKPDLIETVIVQHNLRGEDAERFRRLATLSLGSDAATILADRFPGEVRTLGETKAEMRDEYATQFQGASQNVLVALQTFYTSQIAEMEKGKLA